jgi:hypothetical protein
MDGEPEEFVFLPDGGTVKTEIFKTETYKEFSKRTMLKKYVNICLANCFYHYKEDLQEFDKGCLTWCYDRVLDHLSCLEKKYNPYDKKTREKLVINFDNMIFQ